MFWWFTFQNNQNNLAQFWYSSIIKLQRRKNTKNSFSQKGVIFLREGVGDLTLRNTMVCNFYWPISTMLNAGTDVKLGVWYTVYKTSRLLKTRLVSICFTFYNAGLCGLCISSNIARSESQARAPRKITPYKQHVLLN